MKVGDCCKRAVIAIDSKADAAKAAKRMREEHVGFLVVYRDGDELQKPIGVLTDRDLVLAVVARDIDPHAVTTADVMTCSPLLANETDELGDMLQGMRVAGVRRVPVVDARGALTGIFALDDAIDLLAGFVCDVAGSIKSEQRREWRARAS
jgi:predicted transcriptional regulator